MDSSPKAKSGGGMHEFRHRKIQLTGFRMLLMERSLGYRDIKASRFFLGNPVGDRNSASRFTRNG
jgi:hypothetical protein